MMFKLKLDPGAFIPESAHIDDAGYDIRTPKNFSIYPGESASVDTGIHIAIPRGYVGFLKSKSGLNVRFGLTGEGVIDSGFTGSIIVKLFNNSHVAKHFYRGDKIIQIVFLPIIKPAFDIVDELDTTERGGAGFGSTGR